MSPGVLWPLVMLSWLSSLTHSTSSHVGGDEVHISTQPSSPTLVLNAGFLVATWNPTVRFIQTTYKPAQTIHKTKAPAFQFTLLFQTVSGTGRQAQVPLRCPSLGHCPRHSTCCALMWLAVCFSHFRLFPCL